MSYLWYGTTNSLRRVQTNLSPSLHKTLMLRRVTSYRLVDTYQKENSDIDY